jgi:uncharacterized protein
MKIHVDKIPPEGLELEERIEPQRLSLDLEMQGVGFYKAVDIKASFEKTGSEVLVDVVLEAPVEYICSRCLSKFEDIFKKTFNVNYEVEPNDTIDIDEDIRQEMLLDYPMKLLCRPDCKGLCPNCGQNLNIGECDCNKNSSL